MNTPHRRRTVVLLSVLALTAGSLAAHDLFLRLDSYFLPANTAVQALLLSGTFTKSEGVVAKDRMEQLDLLGPAGKLPLDTTAISASGDTTRLRLHTGAEGTYVVGLSLRPREIALTGAQFTGYLKEEGIEGMLAERARTGTSDAAARERYAKHIKAIFQVGKARSDQYSTVLGYTAELVPLENPYALKRGATLRVRCLVNGQPAAGLTVLAGGLLSSGAAIRERRAVSDAAGIAKITLGSAGRWYVKFISMRHSTAAPITHESQWATLTFAVR